MPGDDVLTRASGPTRPATCETECLRNGQPEPAQAPSGGRGPQAAPRGVSPAPGGSGWYAGWKAAADFLVATGLLVVLLPVMLATMLFVRLTSGGPVIYTQSRVG